MIKYHHFILLQVDSNVIELLVAVVRYKTKLSDPRLGVCSTWLANLNPDTDKGRCVQCVYAVYTDMVYHIFIVPISCIFTSSTIHISCQNIQLRYLVAIVNYD